MKDLRPARDEPAPPPPTAERLDSGRYLATFFDL